MRLAEVLSNVKRINGVDDYILVDKTGKTLAHSHAMAAPEKLAGMVYFCGQKFSTIGKKYFKFASFSRKSGRSVIVFPVGTYYLGVVKQREIGSFETASAVMEFLDVLVGKSG